VPTDPFVPADPADLPRQQQNLPPGTALPPARRWRSDRPGDLESASPQGGLFGTPGPNVGFAYTLAQHVADRIELAEHEDIHDVIPVIAEIAGRRAGQFGRAPVINDVEVAMSMLGYDGSADPAFSRARALLVHEAGHSYYRRRAIVEAVPEALLRRPPGDLDSAVYEWRRTITEDQFPELARQPTM
jgi:hypothetical protein